MWARPPVAWRRVYTDGRWTPSATSRGHNTVGPPEEDLDEAVSVRTRARHPAVGLAVDGARRLGPRRRRRVERQPRLAELLGSRAPVHVALRGVSTSVAARVPAADGPAVRLDGRPH